MTAEEKYRCVWLKACFGFENLHFYRYNGFGSLHCKYITDPYDFVTEDEIDLQFVLNALSRQQCTVFFDDIGDVCIGSDQLKAKYLIFKLAGIGGKI